MLTLWPHSGVSGAKIKTDFAELVMLEKGWADCSSKQRLIFFHNGSFKNNLLKRCSQRCALCSLFETGHFASSTTANLINC